MRLIDADNLQFGWCGSELCADPCDNCNKRTISKEDVDNAPTVEYPEQIIIKCDTEEDKQKLLSALRNARLKVLVENERPQGEVIICDSRSDIQLAECLKELSELKEGGDE